MAEILPYGSDIDNASVTPNPTTGRVNLQTYLRNQVDAWGGAYQSASVPATAAPQVMGASGNITGGVQVYGAGSNPAGTAAAYVVAAFTIAAGTLDQAGRAVQFSAFGSFAANTNSKTVQIYYNCTTATVGSAQTGGTAIASTGAVTQSGGGWVLQAQVVKYGANGSNTQVALHEAAQVSTVVTPVAPQALTANESNAILCALTINCATTATDAALYAFIATGFN